MRKATTKGGIILEDIKIGDIHYEYEYNCCIKSEVITQPVREETKDGDVVWSWQARNVNNPKHIIDYSTSEKMSHYGPNVYNYEAYMGCTML